MLAGFIWLRMGESVEASLEGDNELPVTTKGQGIS
jgi:hypothetical protein